MATPASILKDAIKAVTATIPALSAIVFTWKKSFATIREGENTPRIDAFIKRRWKEPFTAEDDAAWLGHYEIEIVLIYSNPSRIMQSETALSLELDFESIRGALTVKLIDIPTMQAAINDINPNLILDDVIPRPSKDFAGSALLKEVNYIPLSLEYTLQESRTGVY